MAQGLAILEEDFDSTLVLRPCHRRLPVKVNAATRGSSTEGVKIRLIRQSPPAGSVFSRQLFSLMRQSSPAVPAIATGPKAIAALVSLVTVTDCARAGTWIALLRNSNRLGEKLSAKGNAGVVEKPIASVTPARLSFPESLLGRSRIQEVMISNRGSSDLVIRRAQIRGASSFTLLNQCRAAIKKSGPPCVLRIRFTPQSSGSHDAELAIAHNAMDSPLRVPIEGAGRELPVIAAVSVVPASLRFAEQVFGTASQTQQITVGSSGSSNLLIGTITLQGANVGDFRVSSDSCSRREIAPRRRCEISVVFVPQIGQTAGRPSERSASLIVPHNAAGNRKTVVLRGVALPRTTGAIPRHRIDMVPGLTTAPRGWCCAAGKVNESTAALCTARQGFFSTSKAAAEDRCAVPVIR